MAGQVGSRPGLYYSGVVIDVTAPLITVRVSDELDPDGNLPDVVATGTAALGDKVTVLMQPNGRAILIGRG